MINARHEGISKEILKEVWRQHVLHGEDKNHTAAVWISILGEEYGEVCKAYNEVQIEEYRKELIQVAAVALSAVESLDRKRLGGVNETA